MGSFLRDQRLLAALRLRGAAQPEVVSASRAFGETSVRVQADSPEALSRAVSEILLCRVQLEEYLAFNPRFQYSLEPVDVDAAAPEVVKRMAGAAFAASVGPMAAVAGAIADLAVEAMGQIGAQVRVVENGGEVAAGSLYPVNLEVLSGDPTIKMRLGFVLLPDRMPIGVGSSSATQGRGITFGDADVATVFAVNAATADAAATAVCNAVADENLQGSIMRGLETAEEIPGVVGALIIRRGHIGTFGDLPELVEFKP
ncbi:MAG: UPF0280 family protein [Candidatus Bathyarchaeia archaeon]